MRRRLLFALGLLLAPVGVAVGLPGPIVRAQAPYRPELVGIPGDSGCSVAPRRGCCAANAS